MNFVAAAMRLDYEAGLPITRLIEKYNSSRDTVRAALVAQGIIVRRGRPKLNRPSRIRLPRKRGPRDEARAAEFRRRYLAGETLREIGDSHGITRERVRQVLRE